MEEITGKIEWLSEKPTEYPAESGDFNIGLKVKGAFYNIYKSKEELERILKNSLKKGYEVKLKVVGNKIEDLEVTKVVADTTGSSKIKSQKLKIGEKEYDVEYAEISGKKHILFGSLIKIAKKECDEIRYEILEKHVSEDFTKAWIHGRLHIKTQDGKEMYFDAMGSSTPANTGKMTSDHPLEMADTRWKGRTIRIFLGVGEAMSEEIKQE